MTWAERAAERSPSVQRSRDRSMAQAAQIVTAARRLTLEKGDQFTTQELAKEAGVAVQTFYRYFQSKDQLLLAVFENVMSETSVHLGEAAKGLEDPLDRLRLYIFRALHALDNTAQQFGGAKFTTSQHWRLGELFPEEMVSAVQPFTDLIAEALSAAKEAGTVDVRDVSVAATLIARVVRSTFHDYAFAAVQPDLDVIAEQVWSFCLCGIGAVSKPAAVRLAPGA